MADESAWTSLARRLSQIVLRHARRVITRRNALRLATSLTLAAGAVVGAAIALVLWTAWRLPVDRPLEPLDQPAVVLLGSDGVPIARRGLYKEAPVDVGKLPAHVTDAILAVEDRRFYRHAGLDVSGLVRASLANMAAGHVVQGGSTITQQLAKNAYVGSERTFGRKLREAVVALALELRLDKDEILSRYLSSAYFGDGVYGFRAAARHYFDKSPEALSLEEAALLAGIVRAPSQLAPTRHPARAQARTEAVLAAMVASGKLDPARAAASRPVRLHPGRASVRSSGWFADWVTPTVRPSLKPAYGEAVVRTTLDPALQKHAQRVVSDALSGGPRGRQAALVAMRRDGSVVAMVGGRDYGKSQYNRAVQARRQPGSAFKLFVYLAALRDGATPWSLVEDAPIKVEGWAPKNADGGHRGVVTLEEAFARSSNLAAVRVSEYVGRDAVIRAARDLGVKSKIDPVPSVALGTANLSLLELTAAYAAVAAGYYPVEPVALIDAPRHDRQRPMPEREDLLQLLNAAVEHGTGGAASLPLPAYGKTGTTQNHRDAWFVGFAGDLVVGVWVGTDDESPMAGVSGGGLPARIWRRFMMTALADEVAAATAPPMPPDRVDQAPTDWRDRLIELFGLDRLF